MKAVAVRHLGIALILSIAFAPPLHGQDCNTNTVADETDLAGGTSQDCNGNNVPDECDLSGGTSDDCNANAVTDECEGCAIDSVDNGAFSNMFAFANNGGGADPSECADDFEVACAGRITDATFSDIEDNAYAWNGTLTVALFPNIVGNKPGETAQVGVIVPATRVQQGTFAGRKRWNYTIAGLDIVIPGGGKWWMAIKPNSDGVTGQAFWLVSHAPSTIGEESYFRSEALGIPDWVPGSSVSGIVPVDLVFALTIQGSDDCNSNAVPDECEPDCNTNDIADECDIASGESADANADGVPDDCELYFAGFLHAALGSAQLAQTSDGALLVSNIGSSGQDGVAVSTFEAQGYCMPLDPPCPGDFGVGTALNLATWGGTFTEPVKLGDLKFQSTGSAVNLVTDFSPNPAPCTWVIVCNGNQQVLAKCVPNGAVASVPNDACVKEVDWFTFNSQSSGFSLLFTQPITFTVGGMTAVGDRVKIFPDFTTGGNVAPLARFELRSALIPELLVTGGVVQMFDHLEVALGNARLGPVNDGLEISNIGSSGQDGVSIDLGMVDGVDVLLDTIDDGEVVDNAELRVRTIGSLDGVPEQSLGELRVLKYCCLGSSGQDGVDITVTFDELESPTHRIQLLAEGVLIADIPGHTGGVGQASRWPKKLGKLGGQTECFVACMPPDNFFVIDGIEYPGDEIRILAEGGGQTIDFKSAFEIRALQLDQVVINNVNVLKPLAELHVTPQVMPPPGCCWTFDLLQTWGVAGNINTVKAQVTGATVTSASGGNSTPVIDSTNTMVTFDTSTLDCGQSILVTMCFGNITASPIIINVFGMDTNGNVGPFTVDTVDISDPACDPDCNTNGISDATEIANNPTLDSNNNGVLDICENDCNSNGFPDPDDITNGTSSDCNTNGIPDECETGDCNTNGILDVCELVPCCGDDADPGTPPCNDCNNNGVLDVCDVAGGTSQDCNGNGKPDDCEDCNTNGVADDCDIAAGVSVDANGDGIPDECQDCNMNGIPDWLDIANGHSQDCNGNGIPDECEFCSIDFQPAAGYVFAPNSPWSVCCGDFDGDGDNDLATAGGPQIGVTFNNGAGVFGAPVFYNVPNGSLDIICCDLDNDGAPDLAITDSMSGGSVWVLLNNGSGVFGAPIPYAANATPARITCGDFNGDGWNDLAVANLNGFSNPGTLSILLNNLNGTFTTLGPVPIGIFPMDIQTCDLDGDADLDVITTGGNDVWVMQNNGAGVFAPFSPPTYNLGAQVVGLACCDLDNDGDEDIAAMANTFPNDAQVLLNNGNGTFAAPVVWAMGSPQHAYSLAITCCDFDQDGDEDLAAPYEGGPPYLSVICNMGNAQFSGPKFFPSVLGGSKATDIECCDLNCDGCPDLVIAQPGSQSLSVFLNKCNPYHANDCNTNGIPDDCDIQSGSSIDANGDGIPDECEHDCNTNGVPDEDDIASGVSLDCNTNGIPDECDPDCNCNEIPDDCDIQSGLSFDSNFNGIPDECEGECCGARPRYDNGSYLSFLGGPVAVNTHHRPNPGDFVVNVIDLTPPYGPPDTNYTPLFYNHPSWTRSNLGQVFGTTLDDVGNAYVAHSSSYNSDNLGSLGGPGSIYKLDAVTGAASLFVTLPNALDPNISPPSEAWPGLGNICFNCDARVLYASNFEDGKIYRISTAGVVLTTFDHGVADNGAPGFAPMNERVWAVQVNNGRLYYSVWSEDSCQPSATDENTVWSIALDNAGDFVGTAQQEMLMPYPPFQSNWTNPISDISFAPNGNMMIAERSMCFDTSVGAHQSRALEYQRFSCNVWKLTTNNPFDVGDDNCPIIPSSSGGVDYNYDNYGPANTCVWVTGDALHLNGCLPSTDDIYGIQGFLGSGGNTSNSILIDSDQNVSGQDKTEIGDVEVNCPGCNVVDFVNLSTGFDRDNNVVYATGVQDAFWTVVSDPDSTTTEPRPADVIVKHPVWANPQPGTQWINGYPTYANNVNGTYVLQTCFCLEEGFQDVQLAFSMRVDDCAEVYLNGNHIVALDGCCFTSNCGPISSVVTNQAFFKPGINCIEVHMKNVGYVASGLNVSAQIVGQGVIDSPCCDKQGVHGLKFNDLDGDGVRDPNEPALAGWTITVTDGNNTYTAVTDANGYYYIMVPQPGTYTVSEVQQNNWVQTAPSSGTYSVTLSAGQIFTGLDFGNHNKCQCDKELVEICYAAGCMDNFALPPDPAMPSNALLNYPNSCTNPRAFDVPGEDICFKHTFKNLPSGICAATLEIRMRAEGGCLSCNDSINLGALPSSGFVWSRRIGTGGNCCSPPPTGLLNTPWENSATNTFILDLCMLPNEDGSFTNAIPAMNGPEHSLDIYVQDDTAVDYAKLTITVCPCDSTPLNFSYDVCDDFKPGAAPTYLIPNSCFKNFVGLGPSKGFDDMTPNRRFGHTITGLPGGIVAAELQIRMKPHADLSYNDSVNLDFDCCTNKFAWGSHIRDLPEAGGTWSGNPATVFTLDLGALAPNNGGCSNILGALADGTLDIYIQDDTAIDCMRLRVWTCPPPKICWGLPYDKLGDAVLTTSPDGLIVSNIGSSGQDGVSVDLHQAEFGLMTFFDLVPDSLPDGAWRRVAARGFLDGDPDRPIVYLQATVRLGPPGGAIDWTANFDEIGATAATVQVYLGDTLVDSQSGLTGVLATTVGSIECDPWDPVWPMDGPVWAIVGFPAPREITIPGHSAAIGDRIVMISEGSTADVGPVSRLHATASQNDFIVTLVELGQFGFAHRALGDAIFDASTGQLSVANIGSSGQDGVSIQMRSVSSAEVTLAPITAPDDAGSLKASWTGSYNGTVGHSLGQITIENLGGGAGIAITPDFSEIDSPTTHVQVFDNGVLVADFPGHSGLAAVANMWPDSISKRSASAPCGGVKWHWRITLLIDGGTYEGDELQMHCEGGGTADYISEFRLEAADIPELTLISETTNDECAVTGTDCNTNESSDACDVSLGNSGDCNTNSVPDECDIADGSEADGDGDGIPDSCQATLCTTVGDVNQDGDADGDDIQKFVDCLLTGMTFDGTCQCADTDADGDIDDADLIQFLTALLN